MDKKGIIKVCGIILAIFFIFAFCEIGLKALCKKANEHSVEKQEEKKQEAIYNSEEEVVKRQITEYVQILCDAIKDKDYNYLWDTMDYTYKKYKFGDNIDNLKEYIESNINISGEYEVTNINKSGGLYQVSVGIMNENSYYTQYFTVCKEDENFLKFMFDEYIILKELDKSIVQSDLNYKVSYYYNDSIIKAYVIEIENLTNEEVDIEFLDTSIIYHSGKRIGGSRPEKLSIKSNESKTIELYFITDSIAFSHLEMEINKNGEIMKVLIGFSDNMP